MNYAPDDQENGRLTVARESFRDGTQSTTRFKHRMRCRDTRNCGKRFSVNRNPDSYVQRWRVACPSCGGLAYSDEANRQREYAKREASGNVCRCNGVPFRHQRGSIMGCASHESANREWTYEEEQDHLALLYRPRGGNG